MPGLGLIPQFTIADISKDIDSFQRHTLKEIFEVLSYVGIESVNYAKQYHGYRDQTGNLTSSIGYAIIYDGVIKKEHFGGKTASVSTFGSAGHKKKRVKATETGRDEGAKIIQELAHQYPTGMILVVVAGMEYAAAVESKGYDVISGSSVKAEELMRFMKAELGIAFT